MKKFKFVILAVISSLILFSCNKDEFSSRNRDFSNEQEITLKIKGVESGSFTRASGSEVTALIESLFPTAGVKFTLSSTTASNRTYTVNLGETITLPVDTYNVSAYYRPNSVGGTVRNGYIYNEPRFYVETVIEVNKGQTTYTVDAIYECWALVIDYTSCSKYEHLGYNSSMETFTYFHNSGNLGIAFIYGTWTTQPYRIKAYPKEDSGYEAKSYSLVTDRNYSGIFIEFGKWYIFSSSSVDDTSGDININYPGWTAGNVN